MDTLLSARNLLAGTLHHSSFLSSAIEASSSNLHKLNSDLLVSSHRLRSLHKRISTLSAVTLHADHAAGPASAVLTAHSSVRLLQHSLADADPSVDLSVYLASVRRLEQALAFLTKNCVLAIQWLNDVVPLLDESSTDDDGYVLNLKRSLRILKELKALEVHARLPGGMLNMAMDKLELELRRILTSEIPHPPACDSDTAVAAVLAEKLCPIIDRLTANGREDSVGPVYVEVRISTVRSRILQGGLELGYLELEVSDSDTAQSLEGHIAQWVKDMEFVVKDVIQFEHDICKTLFDELGLNISMDCYVKIIVQSGFLNLLRFGTKIVETKKDAIKLLKLLDVFAVLDGLRLDFNRLFGVKECVEVQMLTRDLIRRVVEGACEIFNELTIQVERQRYSNPPPLDGGVPRLVTFVTDYCLLLLEDKYRPVLVQVLCIHRIWHRQEKYNEGMLRNELCRILKALEVNLEKWSKSFEDPCFASFFLMNNYHYLHQNLKETRFGDLMGEEWLEGYRDKMEFYTAAYLKESWGRLPSILSEEGLTLFSAGTAAARELVKRRLREFNEAYDYILGSQSKWAVSDGCLRENACRIVVQTVVPTYRSYLHNYVFLVERDASPTKYVKYSTMSMEAMLSAMFQPTVDRMMGPKPAHLMSRIRSVVVNQFRATPVTT